MTTSASAGFIAALKASLANSAAGWAVVGVGETSTSRVSATTGTITAGEGDVVSLTSTKLVTTVTMKASSPPISLVYEATTVDGTFTEAWVRMDGAALRTTDAVLNSTIQGLVSAYNAAKDTALTTILSATPADTQALPSDLKAALLASLADVGARWEVQSRSEQVVRGSEGRRNISVSLISWDVRVAVGSRIPANITYIATVGLSGAVIEGQLLLGAASWRTMDATVHSTLMSLGDAFLTAKKSDYLASFTLGPQTFPG